MLGKSWKSYKSRFWELTLAIFLPTVIVALVGNPRGTSQGFLVALAALIISALVNLGILYAVVENTPVLKSIKKAWRNIWGYWWIMILSGLIVMGGAIFLLVPGIIFAVWFMMAQYIFVLENKRGLDALLRSKEYVQGHGWDIFGKIMYFILISLIILIAAAIGGTLLALLLGAQSTNTVMALALGILTVLGMYYYFAIFEELRRLKPELRDRPVSGKKSWWIAATVWGLVGAPAIIALISMAAVKH